MSDAEQVEQTTKIGQTDEQSQPKLSMSFFKMLVDMPSCKTSGICDGCGRCER